MSNRMRVLSRRLGRLAAGFSFATVACFSIGLYAAADTKGQVVFLFAGLVLVCLFASFFLWLAHGFAWAMIPQKPAEAKKPAEALKPAEAMKAVEEMKPAEPVKPAGGEEACGGEETCGADETRRAGETCRGEETCRGDETCRGEEAHGGEETYGGEGDRLRGSSRREIHHHWKARLLTLESLSNCPAIAEALHERE